ncbi:MAG TPA: hypothetical protein VEC35_01245 [Noviherbaspirillum sp.]|nr:hypothetical protein [Noviherbaspirillum sp.]
MKIEDFVGVPVMNGAADVLVTVIVALLSVGIILWCLYKGFMWMADKFIEAIDWMTQFERQR